MSNNLELKLSGEGVGNFHGERGSGVAEQGRRVADFVGVFVRLAELEELRGKARFIRISASSLREGHPHDIFITKEAPNYSAHP